MSFTATERIQAYAGALYGLKLGSASLNAVTTDLMITPGGSLDEKLNNIFNFYYAPFAGASAEDVAALLLNNLGIVEGQNGLDEDEVAVAQAYIVSNLNGAPAGTEGAAIGSILMAFSGLTADASFGAAAAAWNAKVAGAIAYSAGNVANEAIDAVAPVVTEFVLTSGLDKVTGTSGNDTFIANLVDNTNSLQSGDMLSGGAGTDTLNATLGNSSSFAVRAQTSSIENVFITSQGRNSVGDNGDNEVGTGVNGGPDGQRNTVDAELMNGVRQWWNTESRADLIVEDVRSASSATTIGWRNADAGGVDYHVYYDNQYITNAADGRTDDSVTIEIVNVLQLAGGDAANPGPKQPLALFESIVFTIDGVPVTVTLDDALRNFTVVDPFNTETAYQALADAISEQLEADGFGEVRVTLSAPVVASFATDIKGFNAKDDAGTYHKIELSSSVYDLTPGTVKLSSDNQSFTGVNTFTDTQAEPLPTMTQTDVVLDNLGRGSKTGNLEIGAMSQSVYSGSKGIEQFNIDVQRSSWVNEVRSTNNTLKALHIENIEIPEDFYVTDKSDNGDLRIDVLKDVRVVKADTMTGSLTLSNVTLSDAIVAKYLELGDTAANPAADNSISTVFAAPGSSRFETDFNYSTGSGDDSITMTISGDNLAYEGTANREDFELTINTNAGNDYVKLDIENGASNTDNWYTNHVINAGALNQQIVINTGAGNDTVLTIGDGNASINLGTGDDTAYADNEGDKAIWVLNANNTVWPNLQSQAPASVSAVNARVNISFKGFEANAIIADSVGKNANVTISDLQINQAIKDAINNDAELKKLLVAKDGPGRTLIIESLIDGEMVGSDLQVAFSSSPLSTQQAAVSPALTLFATGNVGLSALLDGYGANAVFAGATAVPSQSLLAASYSDMGEFVDVGDDSAATSDNRIQGDTGNDVLVLGTGEDSNDTLVYNGFGNGTDTIVNFDNTVIPAGALQWDGGSKEVVTVTFSDSDGDPAAQTIIFDGVTVNLAAPTLQGVIPSLDVATQFVNQYNAAAATNGWTATLGAASVPVGTAETATLTATDADVDLTAGQTFTVAGLTYTSTGVTTQAQLAAAFANLAAGATTGGGTATGTYSGTLTGYSTGAVDDTTTAGVNVVTFTSTVFGNVADLADTGTGASAAVVAPLVQGTGATVYGVTLERDIHGNITDLTDAAFTGTYITAGAGDVNVSGIVQGTDTQVSAATSSQFIVTYTTATTAVADATGITSVTGEVIGDGALTLANKAAAAPLAGYSASAVTATADGYSVTFTALAPGVLAVPTAESFGLGTSPTDGVNGTFTTVTTGAAAVFAAPALVATTVATLGDGVDYIDFSSYGAVGVWVDNTGTDEGFNGVTVNGTGVVGQKYIVLTESATNDGAYTAVLWQDTATAPDTNLGTIGVLDFGVEQNFHDFAFLMTAPTVPVGLDTLWL